MRSGWKKTTVRKTELLRVLGQIDGTDSEFFPHKVHFLRSLAELAESNPLLSVYYVQTDGVWVSYDREMVFYAHIDTKKWILLYLRPGYLLYGPRTNAKIFKDRRRNASFPETWRLREPKEFEYILSKLRRLKKGKSSAHQTNGSRYIPARVQKQVWERFEKNGCKCANHPNCPTPPELLPEVGFCIDHILPYSKRGSSLDPNNLQILCAPCNLRKLNRLEEFRALLPPGIG